MSCAGEAGAAQERGQGDGGNGSLSCPFAGTGRFRPAFAEFRRHDIAGLELTPYDLVNFIHKTSTSFLLYP